MAWKVKANEQQRMVDQMLTNGEDHSTSASSASSDSSSPATSSSDVALLRREMLRREHENNVAQTKLQAHLLRVRGRVHVKVRVRPANSEESRYKAVSEAVGDKELAFMDPRRYVGSDVVTGHCRGAHLLFFIFCSVFTVSVFTVSIFTVFICFYCFSLVSHLFLTCFSLVCHLFLTCFSLVCHLFFTCFIVSMFPNPSYSYLPSTSDRWRPFAFDGVHGVTASQSEVFHDLAALSTLVRPFLASLLFPDNQCIFFSHFFPDFDLFS